MSFAGLADEAVVVRAPNHLGDLVMALPALQAAPAADVVVARPLAPLLALEPRAGRIIALARGARGFAAAAAALRGRRYQRGILLPPSFSSAALMRAGGVRRLRGLATDPRAPLLHDAVPRSRATARHRSALYLELVTGQAAEPSAPRFRVPTHEIARWRTLLGHDRPYVAVFPGGNASSRRWDPTRFAAVVQALVAEGREVVVLGGAQERAVTAAVAAGGAFDAGGRTDLPMLAAALAECHILLSNDSGPLHLAAAVGVPTVSLWGAGDPRETGVLGEAHRLLRHPELPCVPCVKNECPRRGRGYRLPDAERECLQLIEVPDVLSAIRAR